MSGVNLGIFQGLLDAVSTERPKPLPEDFGLDDTAPMRVDAERERRKRIAQMPPTVGDFAGMAVFGIMFGAVAGWLPALLLAGLTQQPWILIALPAVGAAAGIAMAFHAQCSRAVGIRTARETADFATIAEIESVTRFRQADADWGQDAWKRWCAKTGHAFERDLGGALRCAGWKVETTQASVDGGVDIVGHDPQGRPVAIQCKWWTSPCGVGPIRELFGVVCTRPPRTYGIVVCKSGFTRQAVKFASEAGVVLWKREEVRDLIQIACKRQRLKGPTRPHVAAPTLSVKVASQGRSRRRDH